ncbi:hypothetical protein EJ357_29110 [Streptomyces cyaneochromogenes]|uniref:Uncharacterized protein n=1 Tax=Streptomyces cyaneochromogenes TaxID=2496836 RepID=A0A3Q9EWF7_9ACTN|nr:hypothetical protein [Streptomyces cyaneochromogenes]AZQ37008.1 hypothetical protein EJ357_29110 [Streptomyces cyaneochromogenes]
MSTHPRQPLALPASAIPDGCLPWDGEQTRRWIGALPPRYTPLRLRASAVVAVVPAAGVLAGALAPLAGLPGWVAAFVALQIVWAVVRPEAARLTAPALVVVVLFQEVALAWAVGLAVVLVLLWLSAVLRLLARGRQRVAAGAAAAGVTSALPVGDAPLRRGKFLARLGVVPLVAGAVLVATSGGWELADDRQSAPAVGWFVVGLGVTVLASAALGRWRAAGLRREPVPVLRVLMRVNTDVDTEVYAADDLEAVRPLFTVATSELDEDDEDDDDEHEDEPEDEDGDDREDEDHADPDDAEVRELLDRLDTDEPGPLREAVLHGLPYDGAEVLLVIAPTEPDEPAVVEWSTGPVRPFSEGAVRRRLAREKRAEADEARQRGAAEDVAGRLRGQGHVEVRRWRAGWPDWLSAAIGTVWVGVLFVTDGGLWRYVLAALLGLGMALLVPRQLAWSVTADREGLWFNGLRRIRHIAWDEVRIVESKGPELRIGSRRSVFGEWSVDTLRWRWLERRAGLVHPYDRLAAEVTAMWRDPDTRPAAVSDERRRGRPLWPLAVLIALGWTALVLWV